MLRTIVCDPNNSFAEIDDPATISDVLTHPGRQVWLDLEAPTEADFRMIAEEFNLHPLAIEDAHMQHQRPKVEQYDGFYFVVFYSVDVLEPGQEPPPGRHGLQHGDFVRHARAAPDRAAAAQPAEEAAPGSRSGSWLAGIALRRVDQMIEQTDERVILRELAMFMGSNYLITVHADPIPELAEAERRWRANARLMEDTRAGGRKLEGRAAGIDLTAGEIDLAEPHRNGAPPRQADDIGILLYSVLDTIVDDYFPVVDSIVDRVEAIEEQIFERFDEHAMQSIFALKKDLLALRKVLAPERDVLNILTRRDLSIFSNSTIIYFQDIYDHVVRITDSIDTYRDLLSSALDSYLSLQSNRLNSTVQTLTAASIVLMSLSLIAGIYGMNFDFMPELHWTYGYLWALGLMLVIALLLFIFFKRKRWF